MSDINISIPGGEKKRLLTGGKYCPDDIVVEAEDGGVPAVVEEKDVNFYDYDGTLLYSYTLAEVQALTELPIPTIEHDGLVFDGWNWGFNDVKNLTFSMDIGALYRTSDGATVLKVTLGKYDLDVTLRYTQSAENGTTIDWGDGSETETPVTSGALTLTHTYATSGNYDIRIHSNTGTYTLGASDNKNIFDCSVSKYEYDSKLKILHTGVNARFGDNAMKNCTSLSKVTFPHVANSYQYLKRNCFENCYSLSHANLIDHGITGCFLRSGLNSVSLNNITHLMSQTFRECNALRRILSPFAIFSEGYVANGSRAIQEARGVMNAGNTAIFYNCVSLRKFTFGEDSTAVAPQAFSQCYSLKELVLPSKITSIGAQAFHVCFALKKLKFFPTTPPTVANANAFNAIPSTCVVEVPKGTLAAYQEATNYATLSAQMVEAET